MIYYSNSSRNNMKGDLMITHPIDPVYNNNSDILILGSFPSVKSRESMFFYGHPQNRFWKVTAAVFECSVPQTVQEKKSFLISNHIAVWDVIKSCEITGSSDNSIKDAVANDIGIIIKNSNVKKVFLNGKTAERYYNKYIKSETGIQTVCLPSTSPANAAWSLERLIQAWRIIRVE